MGRRVTMGVLTLLLGFEVAATSGWAEEESAVDNAGLTEKLPARSFNSKLRFEVSAMVEEGGKVKLIGYTPADQALRIPQCRCWFVEPLAPVEMDAVCKEVEVQSIAGLKLREASDADLSRLRELKGLQTLDLMATRVTDAGLARLKDLTGLRLLLLFGTRVTDAGVQELRKSLPNTAIEK